MKSAPFLVLLLALTTVGGALLSWRQYRELIELRASALQQDDRAELQKRLWDAEKRAKALAAELAAARTRPSAATGDAIVVNDGNSQTPDNLSRRDRRSANAPVMTGMSALMDKPEMQKLMAMQQRGTLDGSYAALFKSLGLNPQQLEKFKDLLVEKQMAMMDVLAATRAQGINPRTDPEGFRQMIATTQAELDASIKATLGDAGFAQYQQYQQTLPQRSTVNQLQQSLSYTQSPLSDAQAEQLVQLLAQSASNPANPGNRSAGETMRAVMPGGVQMSFGSNPAITPTAVTLSQGILSAPQLQALQKLQEQQQAQQQLQQAMRQNLGNRGGSAPTAPPKG